MTLARGERTFVAIRGSEGEAENILYYCLCSIGCFGTAPKFE